MTPDQDPASAAWLRELIDWSNDMTRHLWVIEEYADAGHWSTTGVSTLTRAAARKELKRWRDRDRTDRLRIRCYIPAES